MLLLGQYEILSFWKKYYLNFIKFIVVAEENERTQVFLPANLRKILRKWTEFFLIQFLEIPQFKLLWERLYSSFWQVSNGQKQILHDYFEPIWNAQVTCHGCR